MVPTKPSDIIYRYGWRNKTDFEAWSEFRCQSLQGAIWSWHDALYSKYSRETAEECAAKYTDVVMSIIGIKSMYDLNQWNDDLDRTRRQVLNVMYRTEKQLSDLFA